MSVSRRHNSEAKQNNIFGNTFFGTWYPLPFGVCFGFFHYLSSSLNSVLKSPKFSVNFPRRFNACWLCKSHGNVVNIFLRGVEVSNHISYTWSINNLLSALDQRSQSVTSSRETKKLQICRFREATKMIYINKICHQNKLTNKSR